jgi:hypothetical protein
MSRTQPAGGILNDWNEALRTWWDQSQTAMEPWRDAWTTFAAPAATRKSGPKLRCDAHRCFVPDADIVVHTRIGERRVVPFGLRNAQRRERTVTVGLGPWTTCDGPDLQIEGEFSPTGVFELPACSERAGRLLVAVDLPNTDTAKAVASDDVDRYASAYADLRFEGCARPVRIAIVVHPDHCDSYEVDCGCGC